jgi:hypothetical protein
MRTYYSCPSLNLSVLPEIDGIKAAQVKALANIDKAPYSFAEDIATIRQTALFLRKPFSSIDDLATKFEKDVTRIAKKRHIYNSQRYIKYISSAWLEYRFAFSPLVQTVQNVIVGLATNNPRPRIGTAHGTFFHEKQGSDIYLSSGNIPRYKRLRKLKKNYRATVLYEYSNPVTDWRYKYGLRTSDFPRLAWDLFPYSFMIDRVWNIGDAISGLVNLSKPQLKILSGCYSIKTEDSQEFSFVDWVRPGWSSTTIPDTDIHLSETYTRTVWKPTVLDVIPTVMPGLLVRDLTSIVDLSALILQKLGR